MIQRWVQGSVLLFTLTWHQLRSAESSSAARLFALDLVNRKPGKSEHKMSTIARDVQGFGQTTPSAQCHSGHLLGAERWQAPEGSQTTSPENSAAVSALRWIFSSRRKQSEHLSQVRHQR